MADQSSHWQPQIRPQYSVSSASSPALSGYQHQYQPNASSQPAAPPTATYNPQNFNRTYSSPPLPSAPYIPAPSASYTQQIYNAPPVGYGSHQPYNPAAYQSQAPIQRQQTISYGQAPTYVAPPPPMPQSPATGLSHLSILEVHQSFRGLPSNRSSPCPMYQLPVQLLHHRGHLGTLLQYHPHRIRPTVATLRMHTDHGKRQCLRQTHTNRHTTTQAHRTPTEFQDLQVTQLRQLRKNQISLLDAIRHCGLFLMHPLKKIPKANGMKIKQMQTQKQEPKNRYTKTSKLQWRVPCHQDRAIMATY